MRVHWAKRFRSRSQIFFLYGLCGLWYTPLMREVMPALYWRMAVSISMYSRNLFFGKLSSYNLSATPCSVFRFLLFAFTKPSTLVDFCIFGSFVCDCVTKVFWLHDWGSSSLLFWFVLILTLVFILALCLVSSIGSVSIL